MSTVTTTVEARLRELDKTRKNVMNVVELANQTLEELSKEQPSSEFVKDSTNDMVTSLERIERELTGQINHLLSVSKEQQHEQMTYVQEKDCELALLRISETKKSVDRALELHSRSSTSTVPLQDVEMMEEESLVTENNSN